MKIGRSRNSVAVRLARLTRCQRLGAFELSPSQRVMFRLVARGIATSNTIY